MSLRMDKVNSEMQREIARIIDTEFRNKTGLITVNKVDTSPDFKVAKVYISMLGVQSKKNEILRLKKASGFIRSRIAKMMQLRRTPELIFVFDESIEYGIKMDRLMNDIQAEILRNEEKENNE